MWYSGYVDASIWYLVIATLAMTHLTLLGVTLYLHRHCAHRALELHGALKHFFRFWLWLTTGMITREWVAIHRKHHATCESIDDPHSPRHKGLARVLWRGAELYRDEAKNPDTLRVYGKHCPDDWVERHVYSRYPNGGVAVMALVDVVLFGAIGLTVWAVQMIWVAFWAAGVVNGLGHAIGYRNFESPDASTNLLPWGLLVVGEELHNNHHTYPNSAKLSVRAWEFDPGWAWIRLFRFLGLARVVRVAPVAYRVPGKRRLDAETSMAIFNDRFQVMAQYRRRVILPLAVQESIRAEASVRRLIRRAKRLLVRESSRLDTRQQETVRLILSASPVLRCVYERRLTLQATLARAQGPDTSSAIARWIGESETSQIRLLADFAALLRTYSLRCA
ncbi:fatty acid desaturase [Pseudomonas sp. PDNC002]|uniref:DesA family fatty acid desaturase n=1 Tax=Pseudomonas sp. PDNC002 TaxID=2811422 RepID=UPI00196510CC|nr:fatty acid desaturase [Pseudomonas sp. PDNC002]QRY79346.1 fatty acid desaturase [Pseudomonas sp. PDNC002]